MQNTFQGPLVQRGLARASVTGGLYNPSAKNQRFLPPPFTQGRLGGCSCGEGLPLQGRLLSLPHGKGSACFEGGVHAILHRKGGSRLSPTWGICLLPRPTSAGYGAPFRSGQSPEAQEQAVWAEKTNYIFNMYIRMFSTGVSAIWVHYPYTTPLCSVIVAQLSPIVKYNSLKIYLHS